MIKIKTPIELLQKIETHLRTTNCLLDDTETSVEIQLQNTLLANAIASLIKYDATFEDETYNNIYETENLQNQIDTLNHEVEGLKKQLIQKKEDDIVNGLKKFRKSLENLDTLPNWDCIYSESP